jgi:hypothetical protein
MVRVRNLLWMVVVAGVVPCLALAADPPKPPTNDDCLMCHSDAGTVRADGRPVVVSPETFAGSVHGQAGIACVDCHTDLAAVTEWPHPAPLGPAQCSACHESATTAYARGVHAQARAAGRTLAATCVDCHGVHDIKPSSDLDSRTNHLNLLTTCGRCHGNDKTIAAGHIGGGNVAQTFRDSIHGEALIRSGLSVAPTCSDCHGNHDIRTKKDAESRVFRTTIPATCGRCHAGIAREYGLGIHGTLLAKGSPFAPVCTDCHSAHGIRRAVTEAWRLDVVRECGSCHEKSARTFRDTFHGQVTSLGFTRVAACADCHGAHAIFPKSDPRSSIAPPNIVTTCRKCHAKATVRFAQYDPHADPHDQDRSPLLYFTSRFMKLLLGGVFGFFGLHTLLWFVRETQQKVKNRRQARRGRPARPTDTEAGQ